MLEKVTVLMTTYNEEKNIFCEALNSILNQTYKNIKILIVVDNIKNQEIINTIKEYQKDDRRISYIVNEENLGLAKSLNKGIELIETKYIARMDADDIATLDRIEKQLKFAEEHDEIELFGANIYYVEYSGKKLYERKLHSNDYIRIREIMKYMNIFHHPTFFGKTEIFKRYKYRQIQYSQDYDLVCRLLEDNQKVGNMNDCLLYYRLPKNKNDEKIYKQKISYYCIQEKYKKESLNKANIEKYIECNLNNKNKNRIINGFKFYDDALEAYKQKKYFKFFIAIIKSFFISKYQRLQIKNMIKYYIIIRKKKNEF